MRIGIAQTNPTFGQPHRNLDLACGLMEHHRADLWVLPEFFASGYQFVDAEEVARFAEPIPEGETTQELIRFARAQDCSVVAGLPEAAPTGIYNSAVLVCPLGHLTTYRKIHLFGAEKLLFVPGDRPFSVTHAAGARVGIMICFDHLFPEAARSLALLGADVIAHPSNLVIPGLAQRTTVVRALENGVFVATANRVGSETRGGKELRYTGESQVVDPDGVTLLRLSANRVEAAVVEVDLARARVKALTSRNDKLADRRPELYTLAPAA